MKAAFRFAPALAITALAGVAAGQTNLLEDGSFEAGSLGIPALAVPGFDPPVWDDFGNAFIAGEVTDDEFLRPPPFDGDLQIGMFTALFGSWQFTFLFEELPPSFPFDLIPGEPVDPADPDGNRMIEVTDANGTRMVEFVGVPVGGASLWRTFVTAADIDGPTLAEISSPDSNGDTSVQTPPASDEINVGDLLEFTFWHRIESGDEVQANGAVVEGVVLFRNETFPADPLGELAIQVDLTNDPNDVWVEYTGTAVVPADTEFLEVQGLYFGIATEFLPQDSDADGMQDMLPKDGNFNGVLEGEGELSAPIWQNTEGFSLDTDGDFILDAFDTFVSLDGGSFPGGAAFMDAFEVLNLGAPCNDGDRAAPTGVLNPDDVLAFIAQPTPTVAAPADGVDIFDVIGQLAAFDAGCP